MTVHQCPKCELRFGRMAELKEHLIAEHDADPESLEHYPGV